MFRVPLVLEKSLAVVHRLNPSATNDLVPYAGATGGYDKDFREPATYDASTGLGCGTERENARMELPPVRIPCQVEPVRFEQLRQLFPGNMPDSQILLIFHRMDLTRMKLIEATTGELLVKVNDRISHLEAFVNPGKVTQHFEGPGLFIYEIQPGSFGFGPTGFDLYIVYLHERERAM